MCHVFFEWSLSSGIAKFILRNTDGVHYKEQIKITHYTKLKLNVYKHFTSYCFQQLANENEAEFCFVIKAICFKYVLMEAIFLSLEIAET